ncbi:hypothetical protein [Haloplasma contractile]|uniref:Uncharacterized protein n=1 Tax=Haloplasma contractile SSD-17B TaxID=1033810 RepID=U2EBE6_9MOLU|nr:hypothetical protein [Haloplasma contractile]ERJ12116.1 hypothetical protein HLPCO_001643 [Haloplasma contractile SSD-17B]
MGDKMNRSHKHQLQKLKAKNEYTHEDLEIAQELLKQDDPPFNEEVEGVLHKIKNILKEKNDNNQ